MRNYRYYDPVEDVIGGGVGRKLDVIHNGSHQAAVSKLQPGEHLYAVCDLFTHKLAVGLDDKNVFEAWWQRDLDGRFVSFTLYALDEAAHQRAHE